MTRDEWASIFFGQVRTMRYRLELADLYARMALFCAAKARSLWAAASQAADTAEQAARELAKTHEGPDELDHVSTEILAALDERDEREAAA